MRARASKELTTAEIARRHGIHRTTAARWLLALEKRFGARVVGRRGRRLFTTEAAMAVVGPVAPEEEKDDPRLAELAQRATDAEVRADAFARRIAALERQVAELLAAKGRRS